MIRHAKFLLLLFPMTVAVCCIAADLEPLGLTQVIELVQSNDARLVPYSNSMKLAQLRRDDSLQRKNPELRLGTALEGSSPNMDAAFRYYPGHPWKNRAVKEENQVLADEGTILYADAVLSSTLEAMTLFYDLQCMEKEQALYGRLASVQQVLAERADQQLEEAVITQAKGLLARWDALKSLESRHRATIKAEQLRQALAMRIGRPANTMLIVPLDEAEPPSLMRMGTVLEEALGASPKLQLMQIKKSLADVQLKEARAAGIPWVNHWQIGYGNNDRGWKLDAAIELPFFTMGGPDRLFAGEEVVLRSAAVTAHEYWLRLEVEAAVQTYNCAFEEWQALYDAQGKLMNQTRSFLEQESDDRQPQVEERLALEGKLLRAELDQLTLRREVNKAAIALAAVVGKPLNP